MSKIKPQKCNNRCQYCKQKSEGKKVKIPFRGQLDQSVKAILGGVRSSCTYVGAPSLKQLSKCTTFVRVNQQYNDKGKKQNRFYYTAVTENDGRYYAMGAHGGIGASHITPYNIYGKKESPRMHFGEAAPALRMVNEKEQANLNRRPSWKQYRVVTYSELAAESLSEIEGPTAEATSGGLHSPSSFDMSWEDGSGQSSASIPPNEIAWAEEEKAQLLSAGYKSATPEEIVKAVDGVMQGESGETPI